MMSTDAYKAIPVNRPKGDSFVNAPLSAAEMPTTFFCYYWTQKWELYKQYPGAYTRMMSTDAYKAIPVNRPKGYSFVNAPLSAKSK
ncbi:hypothetical protein CDAR_75951 [Caerostris darwini]|uniref:Uncharacterized protein n=1 Tax=Caerostris darwini TaxID=1538125 RepID=A0AAV4Q4W5_9ARAC|nr:hypothetical protein CDAR_75951 [Caerostris darwini]